MCVEQIGVITAGRFLRESLPEGARVFVETEGCLREVSRVSRWANGLLAISSKTTPGMSPKNLVVLESTPLYVAFINLLNIDTVTVKEQARAVSAIPAVRPAAVRYDARGGSLLPELLVDVE